MPDELDELTGGLRRMWSTARLSGRLGKSAASRLLFKNKSKVEPNAAETTAQIDAAIKGARELVTRMGNLKGLMMKAGQIASYMPGSLPPAVQEVFAELQAQSTPMAFQRIQEVLAAELGERPFDSFEETPFASASIGQVHRAVHR